MGPGILTPGLALPPPMADGGTSKNGLLPLFRPSGLLDIGPTGPPPAPQFGPAPGGGPGMDPFMPGDLGGGGGERKRAGEWW